MLSYTKTQTFCAHVLHQVTDTYKIEPRQANLCLRAFRHDKFQLRMSRHSEGQGIWFSI